MDDQEKKPIEPSNPVEPTTPAPEDKPLDLGPNDQLKPGGVIGPDGASTVETIPAASELPKPKKNKKKMLVIAFVALVLLLGASAGAYFGIVIPNKPENVWATALENTAKGYDKLIEYSEEEKDIKATKVDGTFRLEGPLVADGSFNSHSGGGKSTGNLDVGFAGVRTSLEFRGITPEQAKAPDLYFKASGLKSITAMMGLGASFNKYIEDLDGQWIVVDHTALEQYAAAIQNSGQPTLTNDDYIQISKAIGEVNKEYIFTDNSSKSVLKIAEVVGREDRDGRDSLHYKVTYDKEHLKAYVTALKDKLKTTKLVEMLPDKDLEKAVNFEELLKSIDELKGDQKADVWVDMETKLIRAVRFTDPDMASDYVELALEYNGGDDVPFVVKVVATEGEPLDIKMTLTAKPKTNECAFDIIANFGKDDNKGSFSLKGKAAAAEEPADVTKPEGAVPFTEAFAPFLGPFTQQPGIPEAPGLQTLPIQL